MLPASDFVISAKGLCGTRCRSGCPIKSPFALPAAASDAQKRPHREDCKSGEARSSIPGRLAREWRFVAGVNIYSAFLRVNFLLWNPKIGMSENINNHDCLPYLEWFNFDTFWAIQSKYIAGRATKVISSSLWKSKYSEAVCRSCWAGQAS